MRKILIFIIFAFAASLSFGQFLHADHKKAAELKHRPLIVSLFSLEEEAISHCDSIHMEFYNMKIRELVSQYWTLSDSIIFMRSKKVESIISSKSTDYVILSAGSSKEGQQSSNDIFWYPSFTFMLFLSEDGMRFDGSIIDRGHYSTPYLTDLEMTGQLFRGKYIYKMSFYDMALSENDLRFCLDQFTKSISDAIAKKYPKGGIYAKKPDKKAAAALKDKTLLVPDNIGTEEVNNKLVSRYYDHSFQICSEAEISRAIAESDTAKAYIHYLWSDHLRMYQAFIIDTETKEVITSFRPGQVDINTQDCLPAGTSYRNRIRLNLKHLKRL